MSRASCAGAASTTRRSGWRGASATAREIEKLSGQRHVPLLVIEKEAICDSLRIIEHLEWRQSEQP